MPLTLADRNIILLISNGFDQHHMTEIQRALTKAQARIKIVAPEQGVVHGWQGDAWGHYFSVDAPLAEALGSDFDALVLPGGAHGAAKLEQNPHTRRIVGHFMDANKPIAAIGAGVGLLARSGKVAGRTLAAGAEDHAALAKAGLALADGDQVIDGNLFTATGDDLAGWVEGTLAFFAGAEPVRRAA